MQIKTHPRGSAALLEPCDPEEHLSPSLLVKTNIRTICESASQFQLFESNHYFETKISLALLRLNCTEAGCCLCILHNPPQEAPGDELSPEEG